MDGCGRHFMVEIGGSKADLHEVNADIFDLVQDDSLSLRARKTTVWSRSGATQTHRGRWSEVRGR